MRNVLLVASLIAISSMAGYSQTAYLRGHTLVLRPSAESRPIRVYVGTGSPAPFSSTIHVVLKSEGKYYVLYSFVGHSYPINGHPEFPELYSNVYRGLQLITIKGGKLYMEETCTFGLEADKVRMEWRGPVFTATCKDVTAKVDIRRLEDGIE
jgi:hypothetical protein